jgi:hypothetical protein
MELALQTFDRRCENLHSFERTMDGIWFLIDLDAPDVSLDACCKVVDGIDRIADSTVQRKKVGTGHGEPLDLESACLSMLSPAH